MGFEAIAGQRDELFSPAVEVFGERSGQRCLPKGDSLGVAGFAGMLCEPMPHPRGETK